MKQEIAPFDGNLAVAMLCLVAMMAICAYYFTHRRDVALAPQTAAYSEYGTYFDTSTPDVDIYGFTPNSKPKAHWHRSTSNIAI